MLVPSGDRAKLVTLGRAPKALAASKGLAFCACRGAQAQSSVRLTLPACDIFPAPVLVEPSLDECESILKLSQQASLDLPITVRNFSDRRLGPAGCPDGANGVPGSLQERVETSGRRLM